MLGASGISRFAVHPTPAHAATRNPALPGCRRHLEEQQRQELLERRAGGGTFNIDADIAARRHIDSSKRVLEEAYQTGVGVLTDMGGQRERLKVRRG